MKAKNSTPGLADALAQAQTRIAELEAQKAQLQTRLDRNNSHFSMPPSSILESITDAFVAVDWEFRYVWINSEAERLLGLSRTRLLGQSIWLAFPDLVGSSLFFSLRQAMADQLPADFEFYYPAWQRWFFIKAYPTEEAGLAIYAREITDQKSAQSDLRRQALVLEQFYDATITTDLEGKITHWSPGAQRIFGYQADEVLGQHVRVLYFEEDRPAFDTGILQPLLRHGPQEIELRSRNKSGEECLTRLCLSLLRDEAYQPYGTLSVAVDITAQMRAERALRESEERFRLAFMAINGIVYDWYPQAGTVHRSGNLETILGVPAGDDEATDEWWESRLHPEDASASSRSVIARLSRDQNSYETEFRILHTDGRWVHVSDRGFIIRDEHGVPLRVVGSSHQITDKKRLEQDLRDSNKKLKFQADILAATNDAVIALDASLCIRYCNAAAERIYGTRLADVIGKPLPAMHGYAWLAPEDELRFLADLAQHGSLKGEYIHLLNDGSQLIVHSTVNVLPPESGGGMVAIIRDITERKQAEMRTKNQARQLVRANEDLLHFAYAVSHDLHAPLRTITSFSQLLALKCKPNLGTEGAGFIRWIVEASTRMDTMLRDLLRFATVAGGEWEFSQDVSLEEALTTALGSLRSVVEETQAIVTRDPLPSVAGDAGQLVQLFQNLIGNSLKYSKPGTPPEIHVAAQRTDGEFVISVRDNGLGFESQYAERIFGVFQRLHGKEFSGTGIGLTICKRIVERRGGRIWAEGSLGDGATFSFSIPDSTAPAQAAPAMDWGRMRSILENGSVASDASVPAGHFDELFKLLDLAPAIVTRLNGPILIWTKGAERLFGWTEAEATGKQLHELIKTESQAPLTEIESTLLRTGEWIGELKAHTRDGNAIWLASHKILYRDGSGRPQSVIEVHNNITPLKEAQAALARSSEQRDLALNAAQMGIWRWDSRTGAVEWSETLEAILGMPPGSFEGTYEAFKKRNHPDDQQETQERISEALKSGGSYSVENRLLRNDGSYCWVRGQGKVVFDENNQPAGLIGVVWDISEHKRAGCVYPPADEIGTR